MRVLHAPSNVANVPWAMAEGLRGRGHHVEVWNHGPSSNEFPVDRIFDVGGEPGPYIDCLTEAIEEQFDVFHFHGTRSLIAGRGSLPPLWDLPVLRSLGKRLIFSFHGSDIRRAGHHAASDKWSFYNFAEIPCDEERIEGRLSVIRTFAHHMLVGSVLDRPYAPEAEYLPKAIDLSAYQHVGIAHSRIPVVLHATRRRATKGTAFIEQAIDELQGTVPFEFRLVENVSYRRLLEEVADADIVVEKLLGGDAGVLSLEALAMGKVAVCRIRSEVWDKHPELPVVSADPETFQRVLRRLLLDGTYRREVAERGRPYIERNHSGEVVAEHLEDLYSRKITTQIARYSGWPS